MPGIGALAPLAFELLLRRHGLDLGALALQLAENPARVVGLYPRKGVITVGGDADLVVVHPAAEPTPICSTLAEAHDPWRGRTTTLSVRDVIVGGEAVVRNGVVLENARPPGRILIAG